MEAVATIRTFGGEMLEKVGADSEAAATYSRLVPSYFQVDVRHATMETRIGSPAVVQPGGDFPELEITSDYYRECVLEGRVIFEDDEAVVAQSAVSKFRPGESTTLEFDGATEPGIYRIQLEASYEGTVFYRDAYYFTAGLDEIRAHLPVDGNFSEIVFPGKDGDLVYIPDYRGNHIPDFSHVGYMGGGVAIPEVQTEVTVEPGPEDDTQRIQDAIEKVSKMDIDEEMITIKNRLSWGTGHGWSGANYVAWNTRGILICQQPPTAQNWAIGHVGNKYPGYYHDWDIDMFGYSDGYWESHGQHVEPESLYLRQLKDRLGDFTL